MSANSSYFRNLDGIRFIAAFIVLLSHIISPSYQYLDLAPAALKFLKTISYGGTGVQLFFVMSGFLITYLLIAEKNASGKISLRSFYIRRTLRIWPLYFAVILTAFFIYPFFKELIGLNQPLGTRFWMHAIFLSNFDVINVQQHCFGSDAMSQNITWSISVEEQFYIFWPLIFAFLSRRFWLPVLLLLLSVCMAYRVTVSPDESLLYFHTLSVMPDLATGGLLAIGIQQSKRLRSFFEKGNAVSRLSWIILCFCILFFRDDLFFTANGKAFSRLVIAASMAMVVGSQALSQDSGRFQAGRWHFADKWGKYTYGIYLLHPFAMILVDIALRLGGISSSGFLNIFLPGSVSILITFLLSYLSYHYFEKYFLGLKQNFEVRRS